MEYSNAKHRGWVAPNYNAYVNCRNVISLEMCRRISKLKAYNQLIMKVIKEINAQLIKPVMR